VLDTLLQRGLIEHNAHHLLVTTRGFLELCGLRDLADLPELVAVEYCQQSAGSASNTASRVAAL